MSDSHATKNSIPKPIRSKLGGLRRRIRTWFLASGLGKVMLAALALVPLDLAIDWTFRLDRSQRVVMLLIMLAVVAYVAWRFLIRPLMARLTDEALLFEVGQQNAEAKDSILSAFEFSKMEVDDSQNVSKGMVEAAIAEGVSASEEIDFSEVLQEGRFRRNATALVVAGLGLAGVAFATLTTETMGTWFNRNILIGHAVWPQDFFLDVQGMKDGKLVVPKGDDWPIVAKVRKAARSLPDQVRIEFDTSNGRRTELMNRQGGANLFSYMATSVSEPFQFRLITKKVTTEWMDIVLVERPNIDTVALETTPPAYLGTGTESLPLGSGPYYLLNGSTLKVTGAADKPLSKASLLVADKVFPLVVSGEAGFAGTVPAAELIQGTYTIEIEDREQLYLPGRDAVGGLGTQEPMRFKVRVKADKEPDVKAEVANVSSMIVPNARIPYTAQIEDDFAVTQASLNYGWKEDKSEAEEQTGSVTPSGFRPTTGTALVNLDEAFEIESLKIPVGSRLALSVRATDNDTVSGPKHGESTKILLRVVTEAELREDLLRREKQQRQIFAELVDKQDQLLTNCEAIYAETRAVAKMNSEQSKNLVKFQRGQKLLGANTKPVIDRLSTMVEEIRNNKLEEEDGVLKRRLLTKIITPLNGVYTDGIPVAAAALDKARRAGTLDERNVALDTCVIAQRDLLAKMREILLHMVKNEGFQQAINLMYEVRKSQVDLNKLTGEEKKRLVGEVVKEVEDKEKKDEQK